MGILLDLLKGSAGERNLRNALGRWRQHVSLCCDNARDIAQNQRMQVRLEDDDQTIAGVGDIKLNAPEPGPPESGILYSPTDGIWTLSPDAVYELFFTGAWANFVLANGAGVLTYEWVNAFTNNPLVDGLAARVPTSATLGSTQLDRSDFRCRTSHEEGASDRLRVTNAAGITSEDLLLGSSYAEIRRIA